MAWMTTFLQDRPDVDFTGYDIVNKNIEQHRELFKNHKNWRFETHDIVKDHIKQSFDLILSRHTFQHLKTNDVKKIIKNFINSGSRFLLATNYPQTKTNSELKENTQYRHRPLNLYLKPFYFPPQICNSTDTEKSTIMLWDLHTISLEI